MQPRFVYLKWLIWMLFSTQCSTTAVSTVGVWVFAYNSGTTFERLKMLGVRWVGLHTLNCILIAFEILFNSLPLLVSGVSWSLTIALLYVASTWIYPAKGDGDEPDWRLFLESREKWAGLFFESGEKSALLWFNIFLVSHLLAYLIAFCACRIKFYLFLNSSWLLLTNEPVVEKQSVPKTSSSKTDTKRDSALGELDCEYSAELTKDREEYLHHTSWYSMATPTSHTVDTPGHRTSSMGKIRKWSVTKAIFGKGISTTTSPSPYSGCRQSFDKYKHPGGLGNLYGTDL